MGNGLGEVLVEEGLGILPVCGSVGWVNLAHEDVQGRSLQPNLICVSSVASRAALPIVCLQDDSPWSKADYL